MRIPLKDVTVWHDWFAWHPVAEKGVLYWMETIQRRYMCGMMDDWWEYKPKD